MHHPIPRMLLLAGAFSDDAGSDDELHGMTQAQWKAQRKTKLQSDSGLEALTPRWRNPHLTQAYRCADRRSRKPEAIRWRRDEPIDCDVPHALRGRRLHAALFDTDWLEENRQAIERSPYFIKIDESPVPAGTRSTSRSTWRATPTTRASPRPAKTGWANAAGRASRRASPAILHSLSRSVRSACSQLPPARCPDSRWRLSHRPILDKRHHKLECLFPR